jgi:hypothetical protein
MQILLQKLSSTIIYSIRSRMRGETSPHRRIESKLLLARPSSKTNFVLLLWASLMSDLSPHTHLSLLCTMGVSLTYGQGNYVAIAAAVLITILSLLFMHKLPRTCGRVLARTTRSPRLQSHMMMGRCSLVMTSPPLQCYVLSSDTSGPCTAPPAPTVTLITAGTRITSKAQLAVRRGMACR